MNEPSLTKKLSTLVEDMKQFETMHEEILKKAEEEQNMRDYSFYTGLLTSSRLLRKELEQMI